jgi:hypothetical protein
MAKYFTEDECSCKCNCGLYIKNDKLLETADVIRESLGIPLNVNSGTRCQWNNARSGGVVAIKYYLPGTRKLDLSKYPRGKAGTPKDSDHSTGEALDLSSTKLTSTQIWTRIQDLYKEGKLPYLVGLGLYIKRNFVHISVSKEVGTNTKLREWKE